MAGLFALALTLPVQAQLVPQPGAENPRLQSVQWMAGQDIFLTLLPMTALTVALEPGERITQVRLDKDGEFEVRVSTQRDSLLLVPRIETASGRMSVLTASREYQFEMHTGTSPLAAYVVHVATGDQQFRAVVASPALTPLPAPTGEIWSYRLRGDREVRPLTISDNGVRTRIGFAADQALPAIFAIGPSGEEEVVNGYMRGDIYVIDRVWKELVFRIDKEKASARRSSKPDQSNG
ncbi:MAG: TrbG/VirB9 family P-type conjugative transfer protein [Alteripontixanthobacter sp.]